MIKCKLKIELFIFKIDINSVGDKNGPNWKCAKRSS